MGEGGTGVYNRKGFPTLRGAVLGKLVAPGLRLQAGHCDGQLAGSRLLDAVQLRPPGGSALGIGGQTNRRLWV